MGVYDFDYGYNAVNKQGVPDTNGDTPVYHQSCMGLLVCPHCSRAVMCGDLPTEEELTMIKRGPKGSNNTKKRTGFDYLAVTMLSATHQLATIVDARVEKDNFRKDEEVVVTKLKMKGQYILWTLRDNNPCLDVLMDSFGADESKWKEKEIELYLEEDNFNGKQWIRCEAVVSKKR